MFADTIEVAGQRSSFAASVTRLTRRASHRIARHLPLAPAFMRNTEPLVTFTFDDVPVSAHAAGAEIVEAHGARATFYIATGLLEQRSEFWSVVGRDEVADLHQRGHEIALHSHLHRPTPLLKPHQLAADLRHNREALRNIHPGIEARNFAYPFGQCTLARKCQLNSLVRSSRSIYAGVNRGVLDLHYLRATELCDARLTPERLDVYFDQTRRSCGWLIFCVHDVSDAPSVLGCSRRFLTGALEGAARRGLRVVTLDAALDLIAGPVAPAKSQSLTPSQEFDHG
jgi:peptidoglycan/xylan/chitin deacetylase (PgdA/CDA1 family)